jgi:hypothetical protein
MILFLTYLLKAGGCIAIFYLVYRYILAGETFFGLNRFVVTGSVICSLLLPVWTITIVKKIAASPVLPFPGEISETGGQIVVAPASPSGTMNMTDILLYAVLVLYISGALFFIVKYLTGIVRILLIIKRSERMPVSGGILYLSFENVVPFNWFGNIVISREDFRENGEMILEHERAHIQYGHDFDLLFINLATIFQWFNPFIWRLKEELVTLHEFQADNRVLYKGIDAKKYQYLLIALGTSHSFSIPVVNNLCSGNFKKRIKMMLKKQSNPFRAIKVMLLIPMLAGALSLFSETVYVTSPAPVENLVSSVKATPNFLVRIESSENKVKISGLQGCAFKELTFNLHNGGTQAINQYGMADENEENVIDENLANFLFKIKKTDAGLALEGVKGTAWKELTVKGEGNNFDQLIDQNGMNSGTTSPVVKSKPASKDRKINRDQVINVTVKDYGTVSDSLKQYITRYFFERLIYPAEAKSACDTGKFFVTVKVENGVVKKSKFYKSYDGVNVPVLNEIAVTAYKNKETNTTVVKVDNDHKAIANELERVANKLSEITTLEWRSFSGEFAIAIYFKLR